MIVVMMYDANRHIADFDQSLISAFENRFVLRLEFRALLGRPPSAHAVFFKDAI